MTRYEAFIDKSWREEGLAHLVVARTRESGLEIAVFLADLWCLGVKDAYFLDNATQEELASVVDSHIPDEFRERIHPACAKKLVETAVAYAETLGFNPHRDFRKARRVLSSLDAADCPEAFATGKDGRPCYVEGPDDNAEKILTILDAKLGPDGYEHFPYEDELTDDELADDMLYDFLEKYPAPSCTCHTEFSGLLAALHVAPNSITPVKLLDLFIHPGHPEWKTPEEAQEIVASVFHAWNFTGELLAETDADEENGYVISLHEFDEGKPLEMNFALWCRGFVRTLQLWPEAWGDAPQRPALRPHFDLLQAWANAAPPQYAKPYPPGDDSEDQITDAVLALYRPLAPEREASAKDRPPPAP